MIHFDLPKEQSSIIKVIGIGGGGNNAVNFMYGQGIEGVDFIICNTDAQALTDSPIPNKIQLGPLLTQGLGAGANPSIGKQATEESFDEIKKILEVNTKMAFITAGMGGGTGTGGAPIISRICRELGILTVGIVTTPFSYEGKRRMQQADEGIRALKEYVDTLLVISNDKLRMQFGNLPFKAAFAKADNILATAAKCITDVINIHGIVNVDFADVCTAMRNGGVAILGSATAEGEDRSQKAIDKALSSPLLNDNNIKGAKWILLNITSAEGDHEHTIDEMDTIQAYVQSQAGEDCDVILGMGHDNTLDKKLGVTIIATGFQQKPIELQIPKASPQKEDPKIVMQLGKQGEEQKMFEQPALNFMEGEKPEDIMAPRLVTPQQETGVPDEMGKAELPKHPEKIKQQPEPRLLFELKDLQDNKSPEEKKITLEKEAKKEGGADKGKTETEDASINPGGFLTRPSRIYTDPAEQNEKVLQEFKNHGNTIKNDSKPVIKIVYKQNNPVQKIQEPAPPVQKPEEHVIQASEVTLEETSEQKRIAAERIARLRNISFNVKNMENHEEVETVPAYIRRDVSLDDQDGSKETPLSGYTVKQSADGKHAEISTINTFLDGKKPD
ncbi:MAG: cell division protein FtsZ [Chitinophagaceae bacterium]